MINDKKANSVKRIYISGGDSMGNPDLTEQNRGEVAQGKRFGFGANWKRFLSSLDDERIEAAKESLKNMLEMEDLNGERFLDIGSGSGLFSMAARLLGAQVYSFDYDPKSVACTAEMQRRYFPRDENWVVEHGSVLDQDYLKSLGQFEVVYSWGVLHHTGAMWQALESVVPLTKPGGKLFISIYNDQGRLSHYWKIVKRLYNINTLFMVGISVVHLPMLLTRFIVRSVKGRLRHERGMSLWYDYIDWLGGFPFEVAKSEEIVDFYRNRDFKLRKLKTFPGRSGCNEYVFERGV